ncbi:MAG TPA: ABC transporter permease [Vicinamibacterales bacterium]
MIGIGARERPAALGLAALLLLLAAAAPGFYDPAALRDLLLANAPLLIVAAGMTLVVLAGHIDVSAGAIFGVAAVIAGVLAREGVPVPAAALAAALAGGGIGLVNGLLVTRLGLPSIVVTLAMLVILRDALRWTTDGAWIRDLPAGFQWFGLGQDAGRLLLLAAAALIVVAVGWGLRVLGAGRALYAVGSDLESARLLGLDPDRVVLGAFTAAGLLSGLAGVLNASRFAEVPGSIPNGLELEVIAAVVVGGAAITGGRGSMIGTGLGVALLGAIGTGLTFLGVSASWERALQGAIILAAILVDTVGPVRRRVARGAASHA